jgi:hypothetical protein
MSWRSTGLDWNEQVVDAEKVQNFVNRKCSRYSPLCYFNLNVKMSCYVMQAPRGRGSIAPTHSSQH